MFSLPELLAFLVFLLSFCPGRHKSPLWYWRKSPLVFAGFAIRYLPILVLDRSSSGFHGSYFTYRSPVCHPEMKAVVPGICFGSWSTYNHVAFLSSPKPFQQHPLLLEGWKTSGSPFTVRTSERNQGNYLKPINMLTSPCSGCAHSATPFGTAGRLIPTCRPFL